MSRSGTIELLNEADELERKLDWQLFIAEQEVILYGGSETEWKPGKPLYKKPVTCTWLAPLVEQQVIRPMVEIIDSELEDLFKEFDDVERCEDCGVGWLGDEPCWICGEDRPPREVYPVYKNYIRSDVMYSGYDFDVERLPLDMFEALTNQTLIYMGFNLGVVLGSYQRRYVVSPRRTRGYHLDYVVYDEASSIPPPPEGREVVWTEVEGEIFRLELPAEIPTAVVHRLPDVIPGLPPRPRFARYSFDGQLTEQRRPRNI